MMGSSIKIWYMVMVLSMARRNVWKGDGTRMCWWRLLRLFDIFYKPMKCNEINLRVLLIVVGGGECQYRI